MNIYFEDGQVVDETILATMKKSSRILFGSGTGGSRADRDQRYFRGRGRNQKSEPGIQEIRTR